MSSPTTIAVCGAGIAGLATAHDLARRHPGKRVILIDRLQPMALTTSRSGENFRDYWPQACMGDFVGRSIELMEALAERAGNAFAMHWSGYEFVSEHRDREIFPSDHLRARARGGGPVRLTGDLGRSHPHLAASIRQVVRIERAGAIDVHALGSLLLAGARESGAQLQRATVESIVRRNGSGFTLELREGTESRRLDADQVVLASGPFVGDMAAWLEIRLPVRSYLQRKIVVPDPAGAVPRNMPFTIFADPQRLAWSEEEAALIEADREYRWLLEEFPAGLHVKPEAGGRIKLGWAYNARAEEPCWEPAADVEFPNIVLRGASRFIPALRGYVDALPTPVVQYAGYYTRTAENWPLIGPLDDTGLFVVGALSGYGTMAACAAGELCANWIAGDPLPAYARHFHPGRYDDPEIMAEIQAIESDGQL